MNKQKGFTLIELMIVIAILGILIAIALPAYQDYSIRTKNAECLNVAAAAKLAVSETAQDRGTLTVVDSDAAAGYAFEASKYCKDVTIGAKGVISTEAQDTGADKQAKFQLEPKLKDGRVDWICTETGGAKASQIP
ncbi:MAG: prepilin-type N-terminal cleavage/methylation domain-containing protein, partial [Lysobacter sp.]|nr:prepilin-type N-terminal cleavage/methylation domain-containing protein [Lysobacter sp.]